ncbi:restriction endonuclease [Comamonas sp.]|uniref:restriction endonuclease n=1 Tax=Comamonas sp. TaxID=34028 RepID=UPI0012C7D5B8|nr:restriction endonuclease [Comamonas sp.]MPS94032.1 restriction endonuclease [Comamonas sp.]
MGPNFGALTPTEFENLTYDLLTARGLANATWRTPGADGGRDIEGTWSHIDMSGEQTAQVWYVDCKHYSTSVNWPTVFEKLSYAVSNSADYLLIVCTPSLSPACRNEVTKWNEQGKRPLIRAWEAHYLSVMLGEYPEIAAKFGFAPKTILELPGFVDIVVEASKSAAAAYTRATLLTSEGPSKELELAASLAGLMSEKMKIYSLRHNLLEMSPFIEADDSYDWIDWEGPAILNIDRSALRAIFCLVRLSSRVDRISVKINNNEATLTLANSTFHMDLNTIALLRKICLVGSVEIVLNSSSIKLKGAKK